MDRVIMNPSTGTIHSVVPIGGAPFIQPFKSMGYQTTDSSSSSSYSKGRNSMSPSRFGGNHNNQQSPTSSPSISTLPLSSSDSDSSLSSSTSSSSSSSPTSPIQSNWEAAIAYTSALHEHTRKMWEQERLSIERARLGLTTNENGNGNNSNSSLQKRSTLSGMDNFLKGRKRQTKRASISG